MIIKNIKRVLLGILIIVSTYLTITFIFYKDFGITADEPLEYLSGKSLMYYYKNGVTPKNISILNRHTPEKSIYFRGHLALFNYLNPQFDFAIFHLYNMLFALPIFIFSYLLLYSEYKNVWLALLGPLSLFLIPRFVGDIPANPKDVPFAVYYFISLVCIYLFQKHNTNIILKVLILGLLFGITQSLRIVGVSLYLIYFVSFIANRNNRNISSINKFIFESFTVFIIAGLFTVLTMPIFNFGILEGARLLVRQSRDFSYWDNKILFNGEFLTKNNRPEIYLPVWLGITTPLMLLTFFLASPILLLIQRERKAIRSLLLFAFLANMSMYYIFQPVVYNGLRHFLYLLPIISTISIFTIIETYYYLKNKKVFYKLILSSFLLLGTFTIIYNLISLHPYQYVYFNEYIGGIKGAYGKYDTDYWGASYKEATEWAIRNIPEIRYKRIMSCDGAIIKEHSNLKFTIVNDSPDYVICDADMDKLLEYKYPIIHIISRQGIPLNIIRQVN